MVRKIEITKDHKRKCGLQFKKGSVHKVYKALYEELVTDEKVAKDFIKNKGE